MSNTAWAIVSLGAVLAIATIAGAWAYISWLRLIDAQRLRDESRAERERGVLAVVGEIREDVRKAKVEMSTFIANTRQR